jgi:ABC-type branched-subunit amino acid transport system substrate-binding protein
MTPGMQIRLWLRTAARSQVAITFAVLAAVVALLVASMPNDAGTRSAGASAADGPTGTAGTLGGSPGSVGAVGGAGTAAGSGTGLQSGAPTRLGGPSMGSSTDASGGTTSTSGGSGTGASGTSGAGGSFDLTRSTDRGVNNCTGYKTCVKLGVLIAKIGGLDASGFALNVRTDTQQVVQAYIDDQNKHGGINGRPIVPVFRSTDPISEDDQNQACTQFADDDKVFGVIDTQSFIFANPQACLTQTKKTPYVHGYAESEAFMDKGAGYDVSETRSLDRIAVEWVDEIAKLKFLQGGETVGILEDNCEPSHTVVDTYLVSGIKKLRPKSVKTYESDCSAAYAQSQPPALQQQMCIDGITHVVLATSFVAAQTFLQSADGGPCGSGARKYKYMASDYSLLASDLFTRNFNKQQFDGSLAITNFYTGITKTSPQLQACSKVLQARGIPGLSNSYQNADANAMCDYFAIFVKAAQAAGANLTRVGWAKAVQQLGRFDGAYSPQSVFAPGKTSGGELVHAMVWHADCTCYRQTGPVHPGKG